jgi:hypothetical protein
VFTGFVRPSARKSNGAGFNFVPTQWHKIKYFLAQKYKNSKIFQLGFIGLSEFFQHIVDQYK